MQKVNDFLKNQGFTSSRVCIFLDYWVNLAGRSIFFIWLDYFWLHWVFITLGGLSSSCGEWGLLFVVVCELLTVVVSVWSTGWRARRPPSCGSWARDTGLAVGAHGFSCPAVCGIFPDPGSHPCQLRWQMNSYPLYYRVSSRSIFRDKISRGWVPWELWVSGHLHLWNPTWTLHFRTLCKAASPVHSHVCQVL